MFLHGVKNSKREFCCKLDNMSRCHNLHKKRRGLPQGAGLVAAEGGCARNLLQGRLGLSERGGAAFGYPKS